MLKDLIPHAIPDSCRETKSNQEKSGAKFVTKTFVGSNEKSFTGYTKRMRDHSKNLNLVELIDAFELEGRYFAVVSKYEQNQVHRFRFGIFESGYSALRNILDNRPLDAMPGVKYRYYYAQQYCNGTTAVSGSPFICVWIEVHGKSFLRQFDVPIELLVNLVWLDQLQSLADAAYLLEKNFVSS